MADDNNLEGKLVDGTTYGTENLAEEAAETAYETAAESVEPVEPVRFRLGIQYGAVSEDVGEALLMMGYDINVLEHVPLLSLGYDLLVCETDKAGYERMFGAELEYAPKIVHNLNKGDHTVWDWREKAPSAVPAALESLIQYVELDRKIYLTD
jgi:hypothetical protein